jgi:hypothetical protein
VPTGSYLKAYQRTLRAMVYKNLRKKMQPLKSTTFLSGSKSIKASAMEGKLDEILPKNMIRNKIGKKRLR